MLTQPTVDLLVVGATGHPILAVEVKNSENLSLDDGIVLRRNLITHGLLDHVSYFLLVSQETGFLWNQKESAGVDAHPIGEVAMEPVVQRYFPGLEPTARLRGPELELIVLQWLTDLADERVAVTAEPERSLAAAGLLAAIRGADALIPALA